MERQRGEILEEMEPCSSEKCPAEKYLRFLGSWDFGDCGAWGAFVNVKRHVAF